MNNNVIQDYLKELLEKNKREDDRGVEEYRKIEIIDSPIKSAHGSARVKIGLTEVIVGIKLDVGDPFPDSPDEGILICNSELFPMASPEFEPGPPKDESIELARLTDRSIRESGCVDFKKLCVERGKKVWMVYIDMYPVNADGNLFDAAVLGAVRALKLAKLPKYDKKTDVVKYGEPSSEGIPVKALPILCTVGKIGNTLFLDPTRREAGVLQARLSVATLDTGAVCAMQKGGQGPFTEEEVLKIISLAFEKGKELRKLVK